MAGFAIETGAQVASVKVERGFWLCASKKYLACGHNRLDIHDLAGNRLRTLAFDAKDYSTWVHALDRAGGLAVGTDGETFVVWDPKTGTIVHSSFNGYWSKSDIAPNGSQISITSFKKPLVLVDPETFARRTVTGTAMVMGPTTAWSPDGNVLVMTVSLSTLVVDVARGELIHKLKTPRAVQGAFIPQRDRFVMGDRKLTVFDTTTWSVVGVIDGVAMRSIAVSEDGSRIVTTAGEQGPLQIWSTDDLLGGLAAPKIKRPSTKPAKGQPIKGVFFGVPATVSRAALLEAAESLHYILDRQPPDFAMELAFAPEGRDRHWFRFLGSRGRNYALEPWIECLQVDLEVPLDVVLRSLDEIRARRFTAGSDGVDIKVPDDYLDAARVTDPILVKKDGGSYGTPVTRAEIKNLINTVELYYAPCFSGAKSRKVGKVR